MANGGGLSFERVASADDELTERLRAGLGHVNAALDYVRGDALIKDLAELPEELQGKAAEALRGGVDGHFGAGSWKYPVAHSWDGRCAVSKPAGAQLSDLRQVQDMFSQIVDQAVRSFYNEIICEAQESYKREQGYAQVLRNAGGKMSRLAQGETTDVVWHDPSDQQYYCNHQHN